MAWPPTPQTLVSSPFPVNFGYTYLQVSNTQSTATPTNFQQFIQLPPQVSLNTWPLRFYADPALTQPLYAWYETPTTVWVLLPNGVPANSSINVYFNVGAPDGVYTGMAPYLSSTYGQYDNGANVFTNYWNFAGTSLPSGWSTSSSLTATVNNGVKLTSTAVSQYLGYSKAFSTPLIVDIYGEVITGTTAHFSNLLNMFGGSLGTSTEWGGLAYSGGNVLGYSSASGTWAFTTTPWATNTFYIITQESSGTSQSYQINYNKFATSSISLSSFYFMIWQDNSTTFVQWVRTRAYPPNGVQPSVSFV